MNQEITVQSTKYDRERRMFDILDEKMRTHSLPYETDWKEKIVKGSTIRIEGYEMDGVQYKEVYRGEKLIGHYGPQEKFKRDQYYKVEVSKKVAGL